MKASVIKLVLFCGLVILTGCSAKPPSHGTALTVVVDASALEEEARIIQAIRSSKEALRARMQDLRLKPFVEEVGGSRLRIILPVLNETKLAAAQSALCRPGTLEFRMVNPVSERLIEKGLVDPDYELLNLKHRGEDEAERVEPLLVKRQAEEGLTGKFVKNAFVLSSSSAEPKIAFTFNKEGAVIFAEITRENVGGRLGIVLDGELYAAPVITSEILGGSGEITGAFSIQEAYELVYALRHPLPFPIRIVDEKKF